MSLWYSAGTTAGTNGGTAITGTGTAFVANVRISDAYLAPDGRSYEVAAVVGDTQLTLATAYQGSTFSGAAYQVQPTRGYDQSVLSDLQAFLAAVQGYRDGPLAGRFGDGASGAPGLAFLDDLDTGLRRIAANKMAIQTGGVDRVTLDGVAAKIDVPVTGTAVQSSSVDETSGRLLKVGAFGLGGSVLLSGATDLKDRALRPGLYSYVASATPGGPESAAWNHTLIVNQISADGRRSFISVRTTASTPRIWTGAQSTDTGAILWSEIYTAGTVLGTVSQVAGVPTGAIIEQGSNANGTYTKFADGTMLAQKIVAIPSHNVNVAYGPLFISDNNVMSGNQNFPVAFTEAPGVSVTSVTNGLVVGQVVGGAATVLAWPNSLFFLRGVSTSSVTGNIYLTANGRWF